MINEALHDGLDSVVVVATELIMPTMLTVLVVGGVLRALIYFTISREANFAIELEKRVNAFLETPPGGITSFFVATKRLLEKTYYEMFVVRSIMKRRRPDAVDTLTDRIFLIQHGCARMVNSTMKSIRFLRYGNSTPKFIDVSKNIFENNRCFNRLFGVLPVGSINDILNVLPGLFIVAGIFGTFLGIMKGLPELSGMDLADPEGSKKIMDAFLVKCSYAMATSSMGIMCSVALTLFNTALSPEKLFIASVNRFDTILNSLWLRCSDNEAPQDMKEFDEHKDSLEALAEQAVDKELAKNIAVMRNAS